MRILERVIITKLGAFFTTSLITSVFTSLDEVVPPAKVFRVVRRMLSICTNNILLTLVSCFRSGTQLFQASDPS